MSDARHRVRQGHAGLKHGLPDANRVKALLLDATTAKAEGSSQQLWVKGPLACRQESILFQAGTGGYRWNAEDLPERVAVKFCFNETGRSGSAAAAARETEALHRVYACFVDDRYYRVPRSFPILVDHGFVITEWIEGRPLTAHCLDLRCSTQEICDLMRRAGIWLRRFHDSHRLPDEPVPIAGILAGLHETFTDNMSSIGSDEIACAALRKLSKTADIIADQPIAQSWLHGDFKADNIMVSNEILIGIDIHLTYENVVIRDISSFLNHLELLTYHPWGWRLIRARPIITRAFVDGYISDGLMSVINFERALAWLRLASLLNLWVDRTRVASDARKRWLLTLAFRRLTQRLHSDLSTWIK